MNDPTEPTVLDRLLISRVVMELGPYIWAGYAGYDDAECAIDHPWGNSVYRATFASARWNAATNELFALTLADVAGGAEQWRDIASNHSIAQMYGGHHLVLWYGSADELAEPFATAAYDRVLHLSPYNSGWRLVPEGGDRMELVPPLYQLAEIDGTADRTECGGTVQMIKTYWS